MHMFEEEHYQNIINKSSLSLSLVLSTDKCVKCDQISFILVSLDTVAEIKNYAKL